MTAYYNEIDKKAAAWLRELIRAGLIPPGDVDERSIVDVRTDDLAGYTQCHFFAGVGGWGIATRLAGWPDDREIWSASCPCQPFSVAGKGAGTADARHLWPDFFRLVRARRPARIVGEQVAAAIGKDWFDGVRSDLKGIAYACRGVVVPACAVNAPHRRDRLWFVAQSSLVGHGHGQGLEERERIAGVRCGTDGALSWEDATDTGNVDCRALEYAEGIGRREGRPESELRRGRDAIASAGVSHGDVADTSAPGERRRGVCRSSEGVGTHDQRSSGESAGHSEGHGISDVAHHDSDRCEPRQRHDPPAGHRHPTAPARGPGAWDSARWLIGHDSKARRVEPSIPLLVDGLPARAPLLRGYGNAIVPQVAAEVIGALMETA